MIVRLVNNISGPEWDNGCPKGKLALVGDAVGEQMLASKTATLPTDEEIANERIFGRHKSTNESRV